MSNNDIEQKIRTYGLCVNRHLFAYKAELSQLKANVNKREWAGAMPILSMHDPRVMYVPTSLLWPTQLKKCLFFPSFKPVVGKNKRGSNNKQDESIEMAYECDSLMSYAIVVSKKESLAGFYDELFGEVYGSGGDDEGMSQLMTKFVTSDAEKCAKDKDNNNKDKDNDKEFNVEYVASAKEAEGGTYIEDECCDDNNEVLLIYMTESKLTQHGMTGEPFTFTDALELEDQEIHVPHTSATCLYGSTRGTGEGTLKLKASHVVLQDMIEFSSLSLCLPDTFPDLKEFSRYMFHLKSKVNPDDADDEYKIDGNKIAMRLRLHQEGVADLTATSLYGYFTTKDALCLHRKWINMLVGDKTGMNCHFPKLVKTGKLCYARCDGHGLGPYRGLKQHALQGSKSYTAFACALMYQLMKRTNVHKYQRLQESRKCKVCGPTCVVFVSDMYCSLLIQKTLSNNDPYKKGISYECVTEYNTSASFAGNSNDGTGEFGDDNAAGGGGNAGKGGPLKLSKEVASSFLLAAETTKAKFPTFTLDATKKEPYWIKQMLDKIKQLASYMDEGGHGVHLQGRHDKQTKLEMEFKEMIRPCVAYLGTYYMSVRKSAIYRHLLLLTMMYDKNLHMSGYDNCRCIYTSRHCGTFYQDVVINTQPVECDRFCLEMERDGYQKMVHVTGVLHQSSAAKMSPMGQKSSMKIKCNASYMDTSGNSNNDMDAGMMGLNFGSGSAAGGHYYHHLSQSIKTDIELKMFKAIYPFLQKHSKLTNEQRNEQLPRDRRLKKLEDFLARYPLIATTLSHIDYATVVIKNWDDFVDVFTTHYLLNKYNYNPIDLSSLDKNNKKNKQDEKKPPGQHKLLQVVHMRDDDDGGIKFSGTYINRELLTSQALAVTTRIYPNMFHSEKMNNMIYQFRIGETTTGGFSGILDIPIFATPQHAAFAVVLRGPYMSNKEFNLLQLFKDLKELNTASERIKLIHTCAQNLYTYIASSCGYGGCDDDNDENNMLTSAIAMDVVRQVDQDTGILSNPHIQDMFTNIFDHFKTDSEKYRTVYGQILDRAEQEGSQITYIEDDEDEEDEEDCGMSNKKRKHGGDGDGSSSGKKFKGQEEEEDDDDETDDEFNAI